MKPKIIIFIGMPGSGKSTLGRHYAYNTNKAFFDADDIHKPFGVKKRNGIYMDHTNYYNKIIQITDVLLEEGEDVVIAEPLKKEEQRKFFKDKYGDDLYFIHVKAPTEDARMQALILRYAIDYPKRPEQEIIEFIKSKGNMDPLIEKNVLTIINDYGKPEADLIHKIENFLR